MLLAWNGRWETRPAPTPDVVLELTPGAGGLVVTRARPEVQVNGQPWQAPIPLGPGDRIRYGAGGVEVLSIGSTLGGSHLNPQSQTQTQSGSGSSLNPSLGSGSGGVGGRVAAPSVGSQVGRYLLQEPLGAGQFGTVFRARDTQLGREVALKLLVRATERAQQRFLREVQATAKLKHPNLVTTYDGGEVEGWLYLAMEVVIGRDLREAGRDPSVSEEQKIRWIAESARAVGYVNGVGVLHRDLKPSNIMIDGEGRARVVDFGMAGIESEETQRLTKTGAALGTPAYMAPEILYKGGQEAGPASEVYSLGASLYSILTGRSPRQQVNEEPEPLGQVAPEQPEWLIEAVQRAMSPTPSERFPDADAFAAALEAGLSAPRGSAGGLPVLSLGAGVLVLLALGGAGAFVATRPSGSESPTPSPNSAPSEAPATRSPNESPTPSAVALSPAERLRAGREALAKGRASNASWKDLAPALAEVEAARAALSPDQGAERGAATRALLELYLERRRLSELQKLVSATPAFSKQEDLLAAQVWRALDERERALGCLQAVAGERPESPQERAAAALRALWLGNPEVARAYLPPLSDKTSSLDDIKDLAWVAAKVHLAHAEPEPARAWLALLPADDPRWEVALVRASLAEDAKAALKALETRLALQQEISPEAGRTLALLAIRAQTYPVAARWLDRVPRDRRAPEDLALLGRALQLQGRADDAQRAFDQAQAADPILAWRRTRTFPQDLANPTWSETEGSAPAGALPLDAGKLPEHLAALKSGVPPAAREAFQGALELAFRGASSPELERAIEDALQAAPADATLLTWCGRLLVGRDRFERALEVLSQAREAGAPAPAVERLEAEVWLRRGQVDVARRRYRAAGKGDSQAALVARCELGWLQGAAQEGEQLGQRLVEAHPTHAPAWLALAVNQINLGQREAAQASLERAIKLEGGVNARALMFRALLLARAKGPAAQRYGAFEQTFRLSEGASPRILAASVALTRREALPWIQSELSRARAYEPQRPELYLWLGVAGIQAGESDPSGRQAEVDRLWRELLRLEPGFRIPESVAKAYRRRFGEAFRK